MSQWTYRSGSYVSAGNASGGDLTLARPTGTVDGDLVVITTSWEPDTTTISITGGPWESVQIANTGSFRLIQFTKVASSEPANYTISNDTPGDQWRQANGVAYSGGTGSGTRTDVSGTSQADGQLITTQTAPSVTTTGVDRLLVFGYSNFSGSDPSTLTGAASNIRGSIGSCCVGDAAIATASATGTTRPSAGVGTEDYAALHAAYISDIAGGAGVRQVWAMGLMGVQ